MTIIRPLEYGSFMRFFGLIFGILLFGGIFYIFQYNALVDTRFEISSLRDKVVELEAINADLKNDLYRVTESEKLQALAKEKRLILEKNPEFLSSDKWLSDSTR